LKVCKTCRNLRFHPHCLFKPNSARWLERNASAHQQHRSSTEASSSLHISSVYNKTISRASGKCASMMSRKDVVYKQWCSKEQSCFTLPGLEYIIIAGRQILRTILPSHILETRKQKAKPDAQLQDVQGNKLRKQKKSRREHHIQACF
jgi:hypothetical protein